MHQSLPEAYSIIFVKFTEIARSCFVANNNNESFVYIPPLMSSLPTVSVHNGYSKTVRMRVDKCKVILGKELEPQRALKQMLELRLHVNELC